MMPDLPRQGLLMGPSVADIVSGSDVAAFRGLLTESGALALFDYWCGLIGDHGVAMKHLFDVTRVPAALPNIYLEEWDAERQQSRLRLMGETLKAQWRASVVGLHTDDYATGRVNALWKQSDRLVYLEKRTTLLAYDLEYIDRAHCRLVDLALPMDDLAGKKFAVGYAWQTR